jgi:hypothetical protein
MTAVPLCENVTVSGKGIEYRCHSVAVAEGLCPGHLAIKRELDALNAERAARGEEPMCDAEIHGWRKQRRSKRKLARARKLLKIKEEPV